MMGAYVFLIAFFALICIRLVCIITDEEVATVGQAQSTRTLHVATTRGTIYDRNMHPLVNVENRHFATLLPQQRLLKQIREITQPEEYQRLVKELSKQVPAVARLTEPAAITKGLQVFMAPVRYGSYCPCPHLIGYLDNGGQNGVYGLEKAFNDRLNRYVGTIRVGYSINGIGRYMDADEVPEINNTIKNSKGGIQLSIDRNIQTLVDDLAPEYLEKGAVVVLDTTTGGVLAASSFPTFQPDAVAEYVNHNNGALVNRLFSLYDCGSVFKIITAAAALENGISVDQCYDCPGEIQVDETVFHCHLRTGHNLLNMKQGFAQSCNLYFIQLAQQVGAEKILETAAKCGLTEPIKLADGMVAPAAVLPSELDLTADAALANLSFGQGKLLLTPLHVAQMTAMVAMDGKRTKPYLVESYVDKGGGISPLTKRGGEMVLMPHTIARLQEMMQLVVEEGTGRRARPEEVTAAGKTGTAQTGQQNNGKPVVQNWFTGYFPAENPAYVITIIAEDAQNNGGDAVGLFCEISNNLS